MTKNNNLINYLYFVLSVITLIFCINGIGNIVTSFLLVFGVFFLINLLKFFLNKKMKYILYGIASLIIILFLYFLDLNIPSNIAVVFFMFILFLSLIDFKGLNTKRKYFCILFQIFLGIISVIYLYSGFNFLLIMNFFLISYGLLTIIKERE